MANEPLTWVLLLYTLPREPSAPRVAAWRKLKKLNALLLHDAVWVLPARPPLIEHFRWLAAEVGEAGGEAHVWIAGQGLPGQDDALVALFQAQAEAGYQAILAALDTREVEPPTLARRYQAVAACDYFHAPSAELARARLEGMGVAKLTPSTSEARDATRKEG
jgi:Protein ChrB, N-terminal